MSIILLIILILFINSLRLPEDGSFWRDTYIDRDSTFAVKGVFVVLIILSHYSQYITEGAYDAAYRICQDHLNQMVVAMFLFYSGFGIMESIKKKGNDYVSTMPRKRLLTVLVDFDLAIVLYWLMGTLIMGEHYSASRVLFSLIGWKSIGNSNWYIFAILYLYLATFVAFSLCKSIRRETLRNVLSLVLLTLLSMAFVYVEMKIGQPKYCYNTAILYVFGAWYSLVRKYVDKVVMKSDIHYYLIVLLILMCYCYSYFRRWDYGIEGYTVWAVSFTMLVVLFTMKVKIVSRLFDWFGKHVFEVYVLQRLPMNLLKHFNYIGRHKYSCFVLCLICTVLLAEIFSRVTAVINSKLIAPKKGKEQIA